MRRLRRLLKLAVKDREWEIGCHMWGLLSEGEWFVAPVRGSLKLCGVPFPLAV